MSLKLDREMPAVVRVAQPAVADEPLAAATPVCAYSHDNHLGTWRKSSAMSSCVWIQGGFGGKTESVAQTISVEIQRLCHPQTTHMLISFVSDVLYSI